MTVILEEACSCQAQDSEDLNEEQEQWFKEIMAAPTWARPYKPCSEIVIGLKWVETQEIV
jgi:hypothetical protein